MGARRCISIIAMALLASSCGDKEPTSGSGDMSAVAVTSTAACTLPSGAQCDFPEGCPDEVGCNWCSCQLYGTAKSGPVCNLVQCGLGGDAGFYTARTCTVDADCDGGRICIFAPGCATAGRCSAPRACESAFGTGDPPAPDTMVRICACDGTQRDALWRCGISEPYRELGACPSP